MKLAWLVNTFYPYEEDDTDDGSNWKIVFDEPSSYQYCQIKPIVYAELEK
jgi:hypothetical protein